MSRIYPNGSSLFLGAAEKKFKKGNFSRVTKTTVFPGKSARIENVSSQTLRLLVLEGQALIIGDEDNDELGPGQTVFFEDEANCSVENKADDTLIILEILSVES